MYDFARSLACSLKFEYSQLDLFSFLLLLLLLIFLLLRFVVVVVFF